MKTKTSPSDKSSKVVPPPSQATITSLCPPTGRIVEVIVSLDTTAPDGFNVQVCHVIALAAVKEADVAYVTGVIVNGDAPILATAFNTDQYAHATIVCDWDSLDDTTRLADTVQSLKDVLAPSKHE